MTQCSETLIHINYVPLISSTYKYQASSKHFLYNFTLPKRVARKASLSWYYVQPLITNTTFPPPPSRYQETLLSKGKLHTEITSLRLDFSKFILKFLNFWMFYGPHRES